MQMKEGRCPHKGANEETMSATVRGSLAKTDRCTERLCSSVWMQRVQTESQAGESGSAPHAQLGVILLPKDTRLISVRQREGRAAQWWRAVLLSILSR